MLLLSAYSVSEYALIFYNKAKEAYNKAKEAIDDFGRGKIYEILI